jgi:hypothetical protein
MAAGVIYLDIDDEITSAASRIRTVEGRRVAVVLPHGSRVATSRINFRLLARDALTHEKQLSIVANDAATRALAASAGLPVFSSVGEYEQARGDDGDPGVAAGLPEGAGLAAAAEAARAAEAAEASRAARATAAAEAAALAGETARTPIVPVTDEPALERPVQQTLDDMEAAELAAAAAALRADPAIATPAPTRAPERSIRETPGGAAIREGAGRPTSRETRVQDVPVRGGTLGAGVSRGMPRTSLLVGLAAIALAVLIGGVGAYLVLPSATIVVSPREESVGPVAVTILADPTATSPDAEAGVVPAESVSLDLDVANTFPATGKRVETTRATGTVRFENRDPTSSNTIASGSIVRTESGMRFQTSANVTVPKAELSGLKIIPRFASVKVTAVDKGPDGNIDANRINEVPRDENPQFLKVTNPDATSGGKREEFPKVTQKDIDAAMAALEPALQAALTARLADPSIAPEGATVFPETAVLGAPIPTVDPATLLDQEIATFDLGLSANATVTAVNADPVETIAADRLRAAVDPNHRLVDGSIAVAVQPAVISGDQISFPASATARQVAILDAAALKTQVMGRSLEEARGILEAYGTVQLSAWPDWVSTVPTLDGRVELTIDEAVSLETPAPTDEP